MILTKKRSRYFALLLIILLAAAGWKALLLAKDVIPFNSDEAIVALMARHILTGERPTFFYGQVYMGSLDAFLVAIGFSIFGEEVWVIRLLQTLLYLGTIITTVAIAQVGFKAWKMGLMAAVLLAIPAVNTTLYTTASLGGYGEALVTGNLILLFGLLIRNHIAARSYPVRFWAKVLALGFLSGFGLWVNGLTLVYSGAVLVWLAVLLGKHWVAIGIKRLGYIIALGAVGVFVGAAPWWLYGAGVGWPALLQELMGDAVAVEEGSWPALVLRHVVNYLLLGMTALLGFRPPWTVKWLGLPLLPFVLVFWVWVLGWFLRQLLERKTDNFARWLLVGVAGILTAGFLFTSFGVDPSGRYFVPLSVFLSLAAGDVVYQKVSSARLQAALIALVVSFHAWGTWQCVREYPPGLTTQFDAVAVVDHRYDEELITFLRKEEETRGYSNYWVSYPLAFLSDEELIYLPRLPYHLDMRYTLRDDRYEPYREVVENSARVAYITTHHPPLNLYIRKAFCDAGVTWQEKQIGDYQIFYNLSRPVHAAEIGLGTYSP